MRLFIEKKLMLLGPLKQIKSLNKRMSHERHLGLGPSIIGPFSFYLIVKSKYDIASTFKVCLPLSILY